MSPLRRIGWQRICLPVAAALLALAAEGLAAAEASPRLLILDGSSLIETKKRIYDAAFAAPLTRLKRDADRALAVAPLSVIDKTVLPPSGDKHDYMSLAPYWWRNPKTPNGLPYVRRDGEVNPERDQTSDRRRLETVIQTVKTLGFAYFFTEREDYAAHAAKLLRVWFLDPATKTNPHLRHAQAIPGRNSGRAAGIIETHELPELIDFVGLLEGSKAWTAIDQQPLQQWVKSYLSWLVENPEGKAEAKTANNHGTWYDVQVSALAIFTGHDELAKKVLGEFLAKRIVPQIESDGRQSQELTRAQAWDYSIFNLTAMFDAASIADKLAIDLWRYQTNDRRSIRQALDWLIPFATGERLWQHRQISPFQPQKLAPLLRRAAIQYHEPAYEQAIVKLAKLIGDERWRLLYPKMPERK